MNLGSVSALRPRENVFTSSACDKVVIWTVHFPIKDYGSSKKKKKKKIDSRSGIGNDQKKPNIPD